MNLIPIALNNWKLILIGLLLAYASFWQWRANVWEGRYETEKQAFQAFKSEVAAVGRAAEAKAKETKERQDKTTRKVDRDYKTTRNRVSDYYGSGLRLPAGDSGSRIVPAAADSAPRPDGPPEERGASGEGVTLGSCALDAAQVMAWQEWARQQGLPVD